MYGNHYAFFGVVRATLVRNGEEVPLPKGGNTGQTVYREMILQICRDYPGLPDVRSLTINEIRFFYDGLRPELKGHTKK